MAVPASETQAASEVLEAPVSGTPAMGAVLPWEVLESQALANLEDHEEALAVEVQAVHEDALRLLFREDNEPPFGWSTWSSAT